MIFFRPILRGPNSEIPAAIPLPRVGVGRRGADRALQQEFGRGELPRQRGRSVHKGFVPQERNGAGLG